MKQQPQYIPHVACPSCGNLEAIGYTAIGQEYTWWCDNDECGKQYKWVQNEDDSIDAEPTGTVVERNLVLLEFAPSDKKISLIVKGRKGDKQAYYYDEHTCPTNYFRNVLEVYLGDEEDPHGIFEFVKEIDWKGDDVLLEDFD